MSRVRLGDALAAAGIVSPDQLKTALALHRSSGKRIGQVLTEMGLVQPREVAQFLAQQLGVPFVDLSNFPLDPKLATLVPEHFARMYQVLPINKVNNKLTVAMVDPVNVLVQDDLRLRTGFTIKTVVAAEDDLKRLIDQAYAATNELDIINKGIEGKIEDEKIDENDIGNAEDHDAAPIIKLVHLMISRAVKMGASDIHVEPYEKSLRIRFRKDGVLKTEMEPPKKAQLAILSRIKILGTLDIAEKRMPQDGRIKIRVGDRSIDLRLSTLPTAYGEKAVMRILDQSGLKVNLEDLGFEPRTLERFREGIKQPYGIILVTGPTGSGKTTTLYSALSQLNDNKINIMTAEDPIEYQLNGVNQVACKAEGGITFQHALKSFLRQDPDVIMVGEIRDYDTAEIAIKASMTGHLVLSTLHTNDAPSTIGRLTDMGVEAFMITSSVLIIQAQRLVRTVCAECRRESKPKPSSLNALGITAETIQRIDLPHIDPKSLRFYEGVGCEKCEGQGLKGRIGVYEVLKMTETLRQLIMRGGSTTEMFRQAKLDGMLTLRESAIRKALEGITSVEEVLRVTAGDR